MCGIIGLIGKSDAVPRVLGALKRLEYRGYDSAGVAVCKAGKVARRRAVGKVSALEKLLKKEPLSGTTAIGHIRWATHGVVTEANAHPHISGQVAVVHNGIIENFKPLRENLKAAGVAFETETDTEVVAALINQHLGEADSTEAGVKAALAQLEGAFALGIMVCGQEDRLYAARRGSPLVVGFGGGEAILGSDAMAISAIATEVAYLEEGDFAVVTADGAAITDENGQPAKREMKEISATSDQLDKGNHRHYMQKEILEQPMALAETLGTYLDPVAGRVALPDLPFDFKDISRINLIACGTSHYAAQVARYWFETYAALPVEADIASEFRYRDAVIAKTELNLFISQSGETLDTLMALRHCKDKKLQTAAIVNVPDSTMTREAGITFLTHAGIEVGVASTKSFTCQLAALAALAIAAGRARGVLSAGDEAGLVQALEEVPARMAEVLFHDEAIEAMAEGLSKARNVLYLGRGALFPIALEGALKLKEISYIHAEGYPAGEMKHGPIALIEEEVPVVVLAPASGVHKKTASNMQEAITRGGKIILISDEAGIKDAGGDAFATIQMPGAADIALPILYAAPVQLLAYHVAVHKGTDVDQPRNLAKSVTVE
ncbi:MAG: glutamine--fructose-6-phosphate transaminase (isomerizing) [Sphingomonadales bacterium]